MERFLRYSLEHGRKIRLVLTLENKLQQRNALVTALDNTGATLLFGGQKTSVRVPYDAILSCDYARGDHGEE